MNLPTFSQDFPHIFPQKLPKKLPGTTPAAPLCDSQGDASATSGCRLCQLMAVMAMRASLSARTTSHIAPGRWKNVMGNPGRSEDVRFFRAKISQLLLFWSLESLWLWIWGNSNFCYLDHWSLWWYLWICWDSPIGKDVEKSFITVASVDLGDIDSSHIFPREVHVEAQSYVRQTLKSPMNSRGFLLMFPKIVPTDFPWVLGFLFKFPQDFPKNPKDFPWFLGFLCIFLQDFPKDIQFQSIFPQKKSSSWHRAISSGAL